ncbi:hypothetical protein H9X86_12255, partial [Pseudoflavonifractor capillosus]|uniref:hypothetical protein n=1 Tax=Pseudoflavonifractor capillosus TaxID=106588 RepID=UPI00195D9B84
TFGEQPYEDTKTESVGEALGHTYGEPTFTWTKSEDGYTATATFSCEREGCNHTETVDAEVSKVETAATCEAAGSVTYTATATFGEQPYEDTKT